MHPEIIRLFGWPIHSYGLLIIVGFLLATFLAHRETRRRGLPDFVYDMGFAMLLVGIVGGRLWYYIENFRSEFEGRDHPFLAFFEIWKGGLVFYGGAIGGSIAGLVFLWWRKLSIADCLDAIAPFILIAMGFGRLGCFLFGCCFGRICGDSPLGIKFPEIYDRTPGFPWGGAAEALPPSPAFQEQEILGLVLQGDGASLPVFPIQLFEAGYDLILCGALVWFLRGRVPRGIGFPLLAILYGVGRFFLEFLRGDNPETFSRLTPYQNFSILLVVGSAVVFYLLWVKGLRNSEEISAKKS